jgi:alkylation response protein AidB-like acyl-CoA dehydrogenase
VALPAEARIGALPEHVGRLRAAATVLASADAVGAASSLLEMTVTYAKQRQQFGRPIGSFQAVQHKCANMRIWLQSTLVAVYYGAMYYDSREPGAGQAAAIAKSAATPVQTARAGVAQQVHGGVGMTWEADVHLLLRRIRATSLLNGTAEHHHQEYARTLLAQTPGTAS